MAFAMLFPGQASQYVGMLAEIATVHPVIEKHFALAGEVLGYDLWQLVQCGTKEQLDATEVTQPAVFTASVALWDLWLQQGGPKPNFVAGHSLGEYSALVAAEVLSFADGVKLVHKRAQLMAAEGKSLPGKMLIILGLTANVVSELCKKAAEGSVLSVANYNSPQQLVAAGDSFAIDRLAVLAQNAGAKRVMPAAVSVASHCDLMQGSQPGMREALSEVTWHSMQIPVIQNAATAVPNDLTELQSNLVAQLVKPVPWVDIVEQLKAMGVQQTVECGPGKVLTGLMRRIDKTIACSATETDDLMQTALQKVQVGEDNG